uniref:ATP synthase complex subunit 8 n=1 Tax=Thermistis croceocincta TaxID=2604364 RepID=A0A5B9RIK9_9CUCU|nr:ATP synthase F0 subunit 8 [Thermistis croceocincta]QEG58709.1 ATP synthase F0 subunit 8 [Thermistis croceocincta]
MPQMAPLNWLMLFLFFTIIFFLYIILNYYSSSYIPKSKKNIKIPLTLNWKW